MAALLPYILPGALGLLSTIPTIVSMARQGHGGALRRKHRKGYARRRIGHGGKIRHHRMRKYHRRGRGVVADVLGSIPLLGSLLGPLVKSMGGGIHHRRRHVRKYRKGHGLVSSRLYRPYNRKCYGTGLIGLKRSMLLYPHGRSMRLGGLLSPAGGFIHRRGHYRTLAPGHRIRVKGHGMLMYPKHSMKGYGYGHGCGGKLRHYRKYRRHGRGIGGYLPYRF